MMGRDILVLGPPPNTTPRLFHNPCAGDPNFRLHAECSELYRRLRAEMDHEVPA
jgi:hypothetical protein